MHAHMCKLFFLIFCTSHSLVRDHRDDSIGRKAEITQPLAVAQNLLLPQEMVGLDCCLLPVS